MKKQRLLKIVPKADNGYLSNSSCVSRDYIGMDSHPIKNKGKKITESGRSMVEMLGVLAIIGVLSIGAVAGYKFALNKFRANEIIHELDLRALDLSVQITNTNNIINGDLKTSFSNLLVGQYPASQKRMQNNSDYFEIKVSDLSDQICRQILHDYTTPAVILVNEVGYQSDVTLCKTDDLNELRFIYKNDLTPAVTCGQYAEFDINSLTCSCLGNTWFDDSIGGCACPSGKIWSEEQENCIDSLCKTGYFESLSGGCILCDDPTATHKISTTQRAIDVCNACPNRTYINWYGVSNCQTDCTNREFYDYQGKCYSCDAVNNIGMVKSKASCEACGNRVIFDNENCIHKEYCGGLDQMSGTYFFATVEGNATQRDCTLCSDSARSVLIANVKDSVDLCNACPNRVAVGNQCVRNVCQSMEFQGADGACYSCNSEKSIVISNTETAKTACTACTEREVTEDLQCRIADCVAPNHMRLDDGTCYGCARSGWGLQIIIDSEAEKTACEACGNRYVLQGPTYTYCANKTNCGNNYFDDSSGWCRPCSTEQSFSVGTEYTYAWERCNNCPDRHITSDGYCVLETACENTQFVSSKGACISCATADGTVIGTGEKERQRCISCSGTKRFWVGDTCYPCSIETALLTGDSVEEDLCWACGNRYVDEEGFCRLNQSGGSLE